MRLLRDYSRQASTYDRTRGAGRTLLSALRDALTAAPGTALADIGGGTGNYALALAADGWDPLVIDASAQMLARASEKGLHTVAADAEHLPLGDASFDAAMIVSMLHHTARPVRVVAEAARILRPGAPLAVVAFTREDAEDLWLLDYFPSSVSWMVSTHPPAAELAAPIPGSRVRRIAIEDVTDACLAALAGRPELLLEESWRRQTSYFERLARDDPDGLADGLAALSRDVAAGAAPRRPGSATLITWRAPAGR